MTSEARRSRARCSTGRKSSKNTPQPTCGGEGREAIVRQLFEVADSLQAEKASFIGVSSAGNIDPASGRCVYATDNLKGWTGTEIVREMEERYSVACRADNDAVCALIGELSLREAPKDVTLLTFGTGWAAPVLSTARSLGAGVSTRRAGAFRCTPGTRLQLRKARLRGAVFVRHGAFEGGQRKGRKNFLLRRTLRRLFERKRAGER